MKSPLSIVLIAASPRIVGGHSAQASALAAELTAAGDAVSYIVIDATFPAGLRWLRRIPYLRTVLNELLYIWSLRAIVRADVVHVFSASYWSFMLAPVPAIVAAKLLRKPVILHYHSGEAADHLDRWRHVVKPFLRLTDRIVVPSEYLRRVFAERGYAARVIANGIDSSRFTYRERRVVRPRLLSARNLESLYGIDVIIAAFAKLKERFADATLLIAGSGSEERALRTLAWRLGVSGVRFLGSIARESMPSTYDVADVFVNASTIDNQPVSILEAFACGLPVVSTPAGDIPAMLRNGDAGVLVPFGDPAALADAVARLLEDPSLAVEMTRRARADAERLSWRRIAAEWSALYGELLRREAAEGLAHGA